MIRLAGLMVTRLMKVSQKADDQPRMGILLTVAAVGVESRSGAGSCFTAPTAADSQNGARGYENTNWSFSPPSMRRSRSFGQQ
jgi:hypothetical protein